MNRTGSENGAWSPRVYATLRRLAGSLMAGEPREHVLEPTALVNETWLRLRASRNAEELGRAAFLGLAAQAMRRILTEHARQRDASKRGGGLQRTTLAGKAAEDYPHDLALDIDAALERLEAVDAGLARLVELRFYAGCSIAEVAEALELSPRTVKRRWRFVRAWLQHDMSEDRP